MRNNNRILHGDQTRCEENFYTVARSTGDRLHVLLTCRLISKSCFVDGDVFRVLEFFFSALTLLIGPQEEHPFDWSFAHLIAPVKLLLPSPPSSLAPVKSRVETLWYRLTQGVLENGR